MACYSVIVLQFRHALAVQQYLQIDRVPQADEQVKVISASFAVRQQDFVITVTPGLKYLAYSQLY